MLFKILIIAVCQALQSAMMIAAFLVWLITQIEPYVNALSKAISGTMPLKSKFNL